VLHPSYTSGVAGIGYVGGGARTALGWDLLPSGASVMAHEVGHNMGRQHAPCGGAGSPDPAFPYGGGQIGGWGLDVTSLLPKAPTTADVMGYCHPDWISDYNWSSMVSYRQGGPNNAPPVAAGTVTGEGLLIWGRITDTGIVLEPGFRVAASAESAPRGGPFRVDLLAGDGSLVRSVRFDAVSVGDLPGAPEQHFGFVVPLNLAGDGQVAGFRVRAGGLSATRLAKAAAGDPESQVTRANSSQIQVRWNSARYSMVMVRDAVTKQVLSFARGGSAVLWSGASQVQLEFSDGVQTAVRQTKPLQ